MKKIIELANEVCNDLESQDGIWLDSAIMLRDAINVRRKLEATSITEDWLEEHGFILEADGYVFYDESKGTHEQYYVLVQLRRSGGARVIEIKVMWTSFYASGGTFPLSYLLDALELCGIKMEDEK